MMESPRYAEMFLYITTNEDGEMNGIRDDAPDEIKELYREYMERERELRKQGIKV